MRPRTYAQLAWEADQAKLHICRKVYRQGIRDALDQWPEFRVGMTYESEFLSELYDRGVNRGQEIAAR